MRGGGSGPGTRRESVHGGSVAASMPPHGPAARPTAALSLSRCPSEERRARSEERGTKSEERRARNEERGTKSEERRARNEERGTKSEERRAKGCLRSFCSRYFEAKMQCAACRDAPVPLGCANNDEAMST
ncbi:hypothetical protein D0A39_00120 [Xanthomonas campestris pv. campestris]|nr:hypothetical protein D0A39_00120 [Xanthomonas campestris pv. campestris]